MWLLLISVLSGIGSTGNLGEQGISPMVVLDGRHDRIGAEALFAYSPKIETGDGWLARGAVDYWQGPLSIGVAYTRRETSVWAKNVWWARATVQHGRLRLLAEVAPTSNNRESKAEVRVRVGGPLLVEARGFVEWHRQVDVAGGLGYGVGLLVGWAR